MNLIEQNPVIEIDRRHTEYGSELEVELPIPTRDHSIALQYLAPAMTIAMAGNGCTETQSANSYTHLYPQHGQIGFTYRSLLCHPYSLVRHHVTMRDDLFGKTVTTGTIDLFNQFGEGRARISIGNDPDGQIAYQLQEISGYHRRSTDKPFENVEPTAIDESATLDILKDVVGHVPLAKEHEVASDLTTLGDVFDKMTALSPAVTVTRRGTYTTLEGTTLEGDYGTPAGKYGSSRLKVREQSIAVQGQDPVSSFELDLQSEQPLSIDESACATTGIILATHNGLPPLRARLQSGIRLTPPTYLNEHMRDQLLDAAIRPYRNVDAAMWIINKHLLMIS